jgi:hypothetical protein
VEAEPVALLHQPTAAPVGTEGMALVQSSVAVMEVSPSWEPWTHQVVGVVAVAVAAAVQVVVVPLLELVEQRAP